MPICDYLHAGVSPPREQLTATRWLLLTVIAVCVIGAVWIAALEEPKQSSSFASLDSLREDNLDRSLQLAAAASLGEREGTIIVMDPQTGRVRAVVNSGLAFEQNLPPGSTIKPFTALAAFRSGLIDEGSRAQCGEKYAYEEFHTVCSHPRDLAPFNPAEAIAYSCNYYFGKVGERLNPATFSATLGEFGFGRKSGINVERESAGILRHGAWRSQNAIGETDDFQATPIQIINAYSALVNGGHLFTPRIAAAKGFIPHRRSTLAIKQEERTLIVKGMRGAVRYGTAETAGLYSLTNYIFGKTGTATEINGFRTHGWFVGFASGSPESPAQETELAPEKLELAILVFLSRAHGSDAARVAR
ncbi:MAG TPA: penicillin-binding transpeptidase domain-containing protein, partial [Pyrinomonadaceae bacterium]|nr:penicillin-binding transpeptidase domain-containing protein [Pyrinomonadaceae bacterium]